MKAITYSTYVYAGLDLVQDLTPRVQEIKQFFSDIIFYYNNTNKEIISLEF